MVEFSQATCPNCGRSAREVSLYSNGTCSSCGAPRSAEGMEIKRNVFVCANCGSGSSDFVSFFPNGTCSNCGAPAGEVGIIASAEKVRKVGKFALVAYAPDASEYGKNVEKMLQDKGITFLNINDLHLRDVDVTLREKAIEYFVEKSTRVFIVVSPDAGTDPFLDKFVKHAIYNQRPFPITTPLAGWDQNVFYYLKSFQDVDVSNKEKIGKGIDLWFGTNQ